MHVAPYIPPVTHPSELHAPLPGENPDAYWVVTVGQEVRQETWVDALHLYTRKYNEGTVEVRPHAGSRFWPPCVPHTAPSAPASPVSSTHSSEDSIWTHVEDLSEQMSQVTRY
ncbi:hypothetical protein P692DRAFT_20850797 [Suillus brevipes Sb2]|nr:hypothetical protein P692DRAFT_20850797 [Suillus brevipes Sb2]